MYGESRKFVSYLNYMVSQKFIPLVLWAISFDHNFIFNMKFLRCLLFYRVHYFRSSEICMASAFLSHSVAVVALSGISHVACRVAHEQQMYFRLSLLSLWKIMSKTFCFDVGQSDQRIEYNSSDLLRPRALACLGFWQELPNMLWNVNFMTITLGFLWCWMLTFYEATAS